MHSPKRSGYALLFMKNVMKFWGLRWLRAQKISSESPTFWPPKNLIPNHQGSAPSILGTSLLKPKPHHFVSWKPKAQQKRNQICGAFGFCEDRHTFLKDTAWYGLCSCWKKRWHQIIWPISLVCLFFRTVPVSFFGNKHQDIHWHFGFYQNRSPYGTRKRCSKMRFLSSFCSESLHSDPCYPKPIYGMQYNFTLPGTRSCESSYITTTTGSDRSGLRPCLDVLFPCCFSDPLIAVGYSPQYTNYSWLLQSIWTLCMQCDTIVTSDVFIQRSEWSCHLNTKYIFIRRYL